MTKFKAIRINKYPKIGYVIFPMFNIVVLGKDDCVIIEPAIRWLQWYYSIHITISKTEKKGGLNGKIKG